MRYLYVLRGLAGSGKTSFIKEHNLEAYTLSSDEYRLKCGAPSYDINGFMGIPQQHSSRAWKRLREDLEYRMENGEFTIVDATHLKRKYFKDYQRLCKKYFYKLCVVEFSTDIDECIDNNAERYGTYSYVPVEVIKSMKESMETIPSGIRHITPNEFLREIEDKYATPLRFDIYENIYVIGDIHGCYEPLKKVLDKVNMKKDAVIFVGDYFDRGIQNVEVFNCVNELLDKPNVFGCIGNHEYHLFNYLWGKEIKSKKFTETLAQFKEAGITDKDIARFCAKLVPCVYFKSTIGFHVVSHAGIVNDRVNIKLPESYFTGGVGAYTDIDAVCDTFNNYTHRHVTQIFGHRNNDNVPINHMDRCYNVCGFPEYGDSLRVVKINTFIRCMYVRNDTYDSKYLYESVQRFPDRFDINTMPVEKVVDILRHNKYIREIKYGNISSFNFNEDAFYEGVWNKNTTIKARGLFINTNTNEIVARSYDKFFLLDQYSYSTIDNFTAPLVAYKKYDGFLGIVGYDRESDKVIFCSKSTIAPEGIFAELFRKKLTPQINDMEMLKEFLRDNNVSLVFECIAHKEDEHLIKYREDYCILLDIVHNTIEYKNEEYMGDMWQKAMSLFDTTVIYKEKKYTYYSINAFTDDIDTLKSHWGIEGFVFVDANNHMFKLKTYLFEKLKFIRTQKAYYDTVKEHTEGRIEVPDKEKFRNRYDDKYDSQTVDEVYEIVCAYVQELNLKNNQ